MSGESYPKTIIYTLHFTVGIGSGSSGIIALPLAGPASLTSCVRVRKARARKARRFPRNRRIVRDRSIPFARSSPARRFHARGNDLGCLTDTPRIAKFSLYRGSVYIAQRQPSEVFWASSGREFTKRRRYPPSPPLSHLCGAARVSSCFAASKREIATIKTIAPRDCTIRGRTSLATPSGGGRGCRAEK